MARKVCNLLGFIVASPFASRSIIPPMNKEELQREYYRRQQELKALEDEQKDDQKIVDGRPFGPEADSARKRIAERESEIERQKKEFIGLGQR
jgi:hypothetical protein